VFTPNGDRFNNVFAIAGLQGESWALSVYNRWGKKVYATTSYRNDWGADSAPGVYYYLLNNPVTKQSYKGWVEVIR
jgi:gliding motility-associated-like protein